MAMRRPASQNQSAPAPVMEGKPSWGLRGTGLAPAPAPVATKKEEEEDEDLFVRPKPPPPEWIEEVLKAHNSRRVMHWTPPLIWSMECYEYAKRQADMCSKQGRLKHGLQDTLQGRLGQCFLGPPNGPFKLKQPGTAEMVVEKWYNEREKYNFEEHGHKEKSRNFEQVMWFGTTSVGMACSKDGKYCIANYYPAGPDSIFTPMSEKGRMLYFPPAGPGTEILNLTNKDKNQVWFRTNVRPLKEGPPPWLAPPSRPIITPLPTPLATPLGSARRLELAPLSPHGAAASSSSPKKQVSMHGEQDQIIEQEQKKMGPRVRSEIKKKGKRTPRGSSRDPIHRSQSSADLSGGHSVQSQELINRSKSTSDIDGLRNHSKKKARGKRPTSAARRRRPSPERVDEEERVDSPERHTSPERPQSSRRRPASARRKSKQAATPRKGSATPRKGSATPRRRSASPDSAHKPETEIKEEEEEE